MATHMKDEDEMKQMKMKSTENQYITTQLQENIKKNIVRQATQHHTKTYNEYKIKGIDSSRTSHATRQQLNTAITITDIKRHTYIKTQISSLMSKAI